jgi:hypothetical protein
MDNLIKLYKNKIQEYDKQISNTKDRRLLIILKINRQILVEQYNKIKKDSYELV